MADRSGQTPEQRQAELERARAWKTANKERVKAARAAYYRANKEKERAAHDAWLREHPEKIALYRQKDAEQKKTPEGRAKLKAARLKVIDRIRQRNRDYYHRDLRYMLRTRLNVLLNQALRRYGATKAATLDGLLGCSMPELVAYLESKFGPGMSWDRKAEIEIDHIRPISSFDWGDPEQQKACFHHSNLQPLWRRENQAKGSKVL